MRFSIGGFLSTRDGCHDVRRDNLLPRHLSCGAYEVATLPSIGQLQPASQPSQWVRRAARHLPLDKVQVHSPCHCESSTVPSSLLTITQASAHVMQWIPTSALTICQSALRLVVRWMQHHLRLRGTTRRYDHRKSKTPAQRHKHPTLTTCRFCENTLGLVVVSTRPP